MTGTQQNATAQTANNAPSNGATPTERQGDVSFMEALKSGELKAQIQRYTFRFSQWAKRPNGIVDRYKNRLTSSWKLWLGLGAGITGVLMLVSPSAFWQWQFPILLLLLLIAPLFFDLSKGISELFNTYPGKHFIGEVITLDRPIVNGTGSINLQREEWTIAGPDCDAGTQVKIVALDEKKLYVALTD